MPLLAQAEKIDLQFKVRIAELTRLLYGQTSPCVCKKILIRMYKWFNR